MTDTGIVAVSTAKKIKGSRSGREHTLSTGVRVVIRPVPPNIVREAMAAIPDPEVPTFWNETKEREEPNPSHPAYHAALRRAEEERANAAIDISMLMGVKLVDGVPSREEWAEQYPDQEYWLDELKRLERMGFMDLKRFDLDDPVDLEFVFKKYWAIATEDLMQLDKLMGVSEEQIKAAEERFRSQEG